MKSKLALLDSDVIIEANKIGVWSALTDIVEIKVPSIIAHSEVLFYSRRRRGIPREIDLPKLVQGKKIGELTATSTEISVLNRKFDRVFIESLHPGETEALALISSGKASGYKFCSGDKVAIQGLAMIGHSSSGISMENLLKSVGLTKQLSHQFTESYFKKWIGIGKERRITGDGLNQAEI